MTVGDTDNQLEELRGFERLQKTVLAGGYCIGCGACAAVRNSPIRIELDNFGFLKAKADGTDSVPNAVLEVCPFSGRGANEKDIGYSLFGHNANYHNKLGYYLANFAGHVDEGNYRERGSSGGMGTWLASELMKQDLVDYIVHVHIVPGPAQDDKLLHEYSISSSVEEVMRCAKSAYYPVEMSTVLNAMRSKPGRYAIIGVPCFIKALRLLAQQDLEISERIHYCIGLVCGHLKSTRYADYLAWQTGIAPGQLMKVDFRRKEPGVPANTYYTEFVGRDKKGSVVQAIRPGPNFFGASWGYGLFMYKACEFCDDVVAETADITLGDAWLPEYIPDWRGDNLLVVRNPTLLRIITEAISAGRLKLDSINVDEVIKAQAGCYRQRGEGLAYRCFLKDKANEWYPQKRVAASELHLGERLKSKYTLRSQITAACNIAYEKALEAGDLTIFIRIIKPMLVKYDRYDRPLWRRCGSRIKKIIRHTLQKLRSFPLN